MRSKHLLLRSLFAKVAMATARAARRFGEQDRGVLCCIGERGSRSWPSCTWMKTWREEKEEERGFQSLPLPGDTLPNSPWLLCAGFQPRLHNRQGNKGKGGCGRIRGAAKRKERLQSLENQQSQGHSRLLAQRILAQTQGPPGSPRSHNWLSLGLAQIGNLINCG